MTTPTDLSVDTAASTPIIGIPDNAAVVAAVIPGVYIVRPAPGSDEAVITLYDLSQAEILGNAIAPGWSAPSVVIDSFGLGPAIAKCESILKEVFGSGALTTSVEVDPESSSPSLIITLTVPRAARGLRHTFLHRYAREVVIPSGAPVPGLLWEYLDAVPA